MFTDWNDIDINVQLFQLELAQRRQRWRGSGVVGGGAAFERQQWGLPSAGTHEESERRIEGLLRHERTGGCRQQQPASSLGQTKVTSHPVGTGVFATLVSTPPPS